MRPTAEPTAAPTHPSVTAHMFTGDPLDLNPMCGQAFCSDSLPHDHRAPTPGPATVPRTRSATLVANITNVPDSPAVWDDDEDDDDTEALADLSELAALTLGALAAEEHRGPDDLGS